ncbi:hypothetical protein [Erwinia sp. HR93]|uniref:hypothetical protein n=1 Tax=Erwinia sp. HR93 TaxID=3094840 RepID=UPI002ADEBC92|nr:hypothetical protein [Erwinia sp. HR93]MEA1063270.1 hypothetical protein [Erwinia sp. HR93]
MVHKRILGLIRSLTGLFLLVGSISSAEAYLQTSADLIARYADCNYIQVGDRVRFETTMYYNAQTPFSGLPHRKTMNIFVFNNKGVKQPLTVKTDYHKFVVRIEGISSTGYLRGAQEGLLSGSISYTCGASNAPCQYWKDLTAQSYRVVVETNLANLPSKNIALWPGYGDFSDFNLDKAGPVLITAVSNECKILGPNVPPLPPQEVTFDLNVPDWDLGEITAPDQEITLAQPQDRFCIGFPGLVRGNSTGYQLRAQSTSMADGRFNLVNDGNAMRKIAYTLKLDDGRTPPFIFPGNNVTINFPTDETISQLCYTPTFSIKHQGMLRGGNYSDVIDFSIITTP